jgi:DNA invertase Pin-like site-specific DNA recombinase
MVYGYIRVSTDKQNTQVQRNEILEYANKHKMIVDDFFKVTLSSRKSESERQIDDVKATLFPGDMLIVTELSRLGRRMLDILNLIEWFKQNEIEVIFTKQPELSTTKDNALQSLLFSIYGYFAETERELLSQRVKGGIANARKAGKTLGRPKGSIGKSKYDKDKDRIFELYDLGVSLNKIIKNHLGYGTVASLSSYIKKREADYIKVGDIASRQQKEIMEEALSAAEW